MRLGWVLDERSLVCFRAPLPFVHSSSRSSQQKPQFIFRYIRSPKEKKKIEKKKITRNKDYILIRTYNEIIGKKALLSTAGTATKFDTSKKANA